MDASYRRGSVAQTAYAEWMFLIVDDVKFPASPGDGVSVPDESYGYAAYLIRPANLRSLMSTFAQEKTAAGLMPIEPIKRSMDSSDEKAFREIHGATDAKQRFSHAKKAASGIGKAMLTELVRKQVTVYAFLSSPYSATPKEKSLLQWAFDMLIQRVGYNMPKGPYPSLQVVIDRPIHDALGISYAKAFHHGTTSSGHQNFCGPLLNLEAFDGVTFGITAYSAPLQIADFIASACRDFVRWCYTGKSQGQVEAWFGPLAPAFERDAQGQVENVGMKIHPPPSFSIEDKIQELLRARPPGASTTTGIS